MGRLFFFFEIADSCVIMLIRMRNCGQNRGGRVRKPVCAAGKGRFWDMVNEERLRHLIRVSRFDTNDGKQCKPMTQYERKDYVSMRLLGSFVTGTICFGILLLLWGLYSMEELMVQLNRLDIIGTLTRLGVSYLVFMLVYLGATCVVFQLKYSEGRRKVKKYYNSLKKINQMYEREERLKMPEHKDWE